MDRKGLPMRCLHASRPKKSRRRGGTKSLHFAPKSSFWRKTGRRRGARAGSARAPGDGSYFFCTSCFILNRRHFCVRESVE